MYSLEPSARNITPPIEKQEDFFKQQKDVDL